ncbi:MAG: glycosyltransferase family 4 protein [Desulfovibrionaceae bacterium]
MKLFLFLGSIGGGGAQRMVCLLANAWAAEGHEVTVAHYDLERDAFPFPQSEAVVLRRLPLSLPVKTRGQAIRRFVSDVGALRKAIRHEAPDAVVAFLPQANVLAVLACLGTGIPLVVTELCHPAHDDIGRLWGRLRRLLYPLARRLVVQTRDIHDWFLTHNRQPSLIIPNPVPTPVIDWEPHHAAGRKTILAAARLSYQKNLSLLARAFARLADRHPDWDLDIYGLGEEKELLEGIVRDNRLEGRLRLPGWTSEYTRRLTECDLFVLCSRFEGMPMALAEAMACGVACISTDCPSGPADLITDGENGLLVPVEDLDALTGAMDRLMSDDALRADMGRKARRITDRLGLEHITAAWSQCIAAAMDKKR